MNFDEQNRSAGYNIIDKNSLKYTRICFNALVTWLPTVFTEIFNSSAASRYFNPSIRVSQSAPVIVHKNFEDFKVEQVTFERGGHGGGDKRLHDKVFVHPDSPDPLKHTAGVRDGTMSFLIGVAARKTIESGQPTRICSLTDLVPRAKRI